MKVKELIEFLKTQDPNLNVFTTGYEGGFEDPDTCGDIVEVALNYNKDWYYGPHQIISQVHKDEISKYEITKGIVI